MRRSNIAIAILFLTALISPFAMAQQDDGILEERRPFDYRSKYYGDNGVDPDQVVDRRSGLDEYSVFDYINSDIFRGVRILETRSGYDSSGNNIYWVFYGDLYKSGFTNDAKGDDALEAASSSPIFLFPSDTHRNQQRQSALISDGITAEKNPLGVGMVVNVEFTPKAYSKEGLEMVREIIGRNGTSLDGMPIIKRVKEIDELTRYRLVTQTVRSITVKGASGFMIARVLEDPRFGAISPDSFLKQSADGKVLKDEEKFMLDFECLRKTGKWCSAN